MALALITNSGAPLALTIRTTIGGFFGGDRVNLVPELVYRHGETLTAALNWNHNPIDLPGEGFRNPDAPHIVYTLRARVDLLEI